MPAFSFARPSTASPSNFGVANDYNVFVFDKGNFQQGGSEVQGRLAIGGDANIRNYNIGRLVPLFDAAVPYNTVIGGGGNAQTWSGTLYGSVVSNGNTTTIRTPDVRGSVYALRALDLGGNSGSGGTVAGDAVYGTTFRKDTNVTITGQTRQTATALPFSFATAQSDLRNLSIRLKGLTAAGTTTVFSWNGIKCVGTRPGLNVFSVSGNDLKKCAGFEISVPAGATALINVTTPPTAGQMQGFGITLSGGADAGRVLWHFADAGSVKINGIEVKGSVLAPNATVNFDNGQIGGTLICEHLNTTGLFQHVPFTGTLTDSPSVTLLSLSVSPSAVIGGQANATGMVTLSSAAPAGGAVVTLGSNSGAAGTPASVTVAAGQTTATFPVVTSAVAMSTPVTISASYGGVGKSAPLTVNPPPAPAVLSFVVTPASVVGGNNASAVVTLSAPAPVGGAVISLSSANTGVATIPASVTIPVGATQSAAVPVTTVPVSTVTNVVLTATYGGSSKTATLTVTPPVLLSVSVSPTSVKGGVANATGTVTLSGKSPTGGLTVALSSSNTGAATTPASVAVSAGSTTATFTAASKSVAGDTNVTISAMFAGVTKTAPLQVLAPALVSVSVTPASVVGGESAQGKATIDAPAPTGGLTVALSSSGTKATVPNSVNIPAGATESASFTVATVAVSADTTVTITGTLNGVNKTAELIIEAPKLVSVTLSPTSVQGGTASTGTVTISSVAPVGGLVVTLSDDSDKASTPTSVTVSAGATTATFTASTSPVTATTAAIITGTLNGVDKTATLTITAAPLALATLVLNPESVVGGYPSEGTVTLSAPAPVGGQVVTLFSSLPDVAKLASSPDPTTVVIAAGQTSVTFPIVTVRVAADKQSVIKAVLGEVADPNAAGLTKTLTVLPIHLDSLAVSPLVVPSTPPDSVPGGVVAKGVVTISYPAPPGGLVIDLASGNTTAATTPVSVLVTSGQTTAEFNVPTFAVATDTLVNFTATLAGEPVETKTDTLTVLAPTLVSVSLIPDSVAGGTDVTGIVTLSGNAPAGGLVVTLTSSSDKAKLPVPAQVGVAAGSATGTFRVTTVPVAVDSTAMITGALNGISKSGSLLIRSPKLISVSFNPNPVRGGNPSAGTVTLTSPAPAGFTVNLESATVSKVTVPASVSFEEGAATATFEATTNTVAAQTNVIVTASRGAESKTATLTLLPLNLQSLTVVSVETAMPGTVVGGDDALGTVTISGPAPAGGVTIALSRTIGAAHGGRVTVPASVRIAAGETSGTFTVTTKPTPVDVPFTVTASWQGETQTADMTLLAPKVKSLLFAPNPVQGGMSSVGTVELTSKAPEEGLPVTVTSATPAVAGPQTSTVTIAAGETTGTFPATTTAVAATTAVSFTATLNGAETNASLTVLGRPLRLVSLTLTKPGTTQIIAFVTGGELATATVTINTPAPAGGTVVTIVSNSDKATPKPNTVMIPEGQVSATTTVETVPVASDTPTILTARLTGSADANAPLTVRMPRLESLVVDPNNVLGGEASNATVKLTGRAPAEGITVTLASSDTAVATLDATVTVAGGDTATVGITTEPVADNAVITVTASLAGSPAKTASLTVRAADPALESVVVTPNRTTGGQIAPLVRGTVTLTKTTARDIVVTLAAGTPGKVTLPATVTIEAGQKSAEFEIPETKVVTSDTPVEIIGRIGQGDARSDILTLNPIKLERITIKPGNVVGGSATEVIGTAELKTAVSEDVVVALTSDISDAARPTNATVTVPARQKTADFPVTHLIVPEQKTVKFSATLNGDSRSATLIVNPTGTVCEPARIEKVTLSDAQVVGGTRNITGTVTLTNPAISGGQIISLSSNDRAAAETPVYVFVLQNERTATFTVVTAAITAPERVVTISAEQPGSVAQTATLVVKPVSGGGAGTAFAAAAPIRPTGDVPHRTEGPDFSGSVKSRAEALGAGASQPNAPFVAPVPGGTDAPWFSVASGNGLGSAIQGNGSVGLAGGGGGSGQGAAGGLVPVPMPGTTDQDLATVVRKIVGPGVRVENIQFKGLAGDRASVGTFKGGTGILGFEDGIVLSSGGVKNIVGPNRSGGVTQVNGTAGDGDLNGLNPGFGTYDATVLEFDFYPSSSTLTFQYVFSSDEYNEWVGTSFNDVFGFFVNGANVARIPGTTTPVSINNLNLYANGQYYLNNEGALLNTEMDGVTTVLTVITPVRAGQKNHIKLAVADAGDSVLDSNVFIQAGSLRSGDSRIIYVRNDEKRKAYPTFAFPADAGNATEVTATASEPTLFNLWGFQVGTISGAHLVRQGVVQHGGGKYDLEWGIRSLASAENQSFGGMKRLQGLTVPVKYDIGWFLPQSLLSDMQDSFGAMYGAVLVDRASSVCDPPLIADTAQADWPAVRNLLTVLVSPSDGNPRIPAGDRLDITIPGTAPVINGTWNIEWQGRIVASSGNPQGWDARPDDTVYRGVIVSVPLSAPVGQGFEVRYDDGARKGAGIFDVVSGSGNDGPPSVLSLTFAPNPVTGAASGPKTTTGTVKLTRPALTKDTVVYLAVADPALAALAQFPDSVAVAFGTDSATFTLQTGMLPNADATALIPVTASLNGAVTRAVVLLGGDTGGTPGAPLLTASGSTSEETPPQVALVWNTVPGAVRYELYRSTTRDDSLTDPYVLIFSGPATNPLDPNVTIVDTNVLGGATYFYKVKAFSPYADVSSPFSNIAQATPLAGTVKTPTFEPGSTSFTQGFPAVIECETAGATIHYTRDGTEPTLGSPVYTGPILILQTTTLQARAFKPGYAPSGTGSAVYTYTPGDPRLRGGLFEMDCADITGWAWDEVRPNTTVSVDIYIDGAAVASGVVADKTGTQYGGPDGHGFRLPFPPQFKDGTVHVLDIRFAGTSVSLQNVPVSIRCAASEENAPKLALFYRNGANGPWVNVANAGLVDFGKTYLNEPVARNFEIRNVGKSPLSVTEIDPPDGFVFDPLPTLSGPLPVGGTFPFRLKFVAAPVGVTSGTLTIKSDDPDAQPTFDVTLVGIAEAWQARLAVYLREANVTDVLLPSGSRVNYGATPAGRPLTKRLVLKNVGDGPLSIKGLVIPGGFEPVGEVDLTGLLLPPGQSPNEYEIAVRFKALLETGEKRGFFQVTTNNDPNATDATPYKVELRGLVQEPAADGVLSCGDTLTGVLDAGDAIALHPFNGANGYADRYIFRGFPGQKIKVTMESTGTGTNKYRPRLNLYNANNVWIKNADGTGGIREIDERLSPSATPTAVGDIIDPIDRLGGKAVLEYTFDADGLFVIEATSVEAGKTGPYTLVAECPGGTGSGTEPQIRVTINGASPDVVSGGVFNVGTATVGESKKVTVRVSNTGGTDLILNSLSLPTDGGFGFPAGQNIELPQTVAPGGSAVFTFDVAMDTRTVGARTALLSLGSNDPDTNPFTLTLQGAVAQTRPRLEVALETANDEFIAVPDGTTLNFGKTVRGVPITRTLRLRNVGSGFLDISGYSLDSRYTISGLPASGETALRLAPHAASGDERTVTLTFKAENEGDTDTAELRLTSNDPAAQPVFDLKLRASVEVRKPKIIVRVDDRIVAHDETIAFGTIRVGTVTAKTVSVSNIGTETLAVSGINTPTNFVLPDGFDPTFTVAPGASKSFVLTFQAGTEAADFGGLLVIDHNDTAAPDPFHLRLTGSATLGDASPRVIDCGETKSGELTESDPVSALRGSGTDAHYADRYEFDGAAGTTVTVRLASGQFDTFLLVTDAQGVVLAAHDNVSAGNTDSQVILPITANGSYRIEVTSFAPRAVGAYTLSLGCAATDTKPQIRLFFENETGGATQLPVHTPTAGDAGTADFGSTVRNVPVTRTVTVKNVGAAVLSLTRLRIFGGDFTVVSGLSLTSIPPAGEATFRLRFNAQGETGSVATMELSHTDPGNAPARPVSNPVTVKLVGAVGASDGSPSLSNFTVTQESPAPVGDTTVIGGKENALGTVTLTKPVPQGAVPFVVNLSAAVADATASVPVTIPTTVTIPVGSQSATFPVTTASVEGNTVVTFLAKAGNITLAKQLLVVPDDTATAPQVVITAPDQGQTFAAPAGKIAMPEIAVNVSATATEGRKIARIEVWAGNEKLGSRRFTAAEQSATAIFSLKWLDVFAGAYRLSARATDDKGKSGVATPVNITVTAPADLTLPGVRITPHGGFNTTDNPYQPILIDWVEASGAAIPSDDPRIANAHIYYTVTAGGVTSPAIRYRNRILLNASATIKAWGVKDGYLPGADDTATFTFAAMPDGENASLLSITALRPQSGTGGAMRGNAPYFPETTLTERTSVIAAISSTITEWQLSYRLVGEDIWIPFGYGTVPPAGGIAGLFDPTLLPNGMFEIELRGRTAAGAAELRDVATVVVDGGMKIGHMSFSVVDMTVNVAGFPLTVTRTYDSRDTIRRKTGGDFGVGWSLSIAGARLQKNGSLANDWVFRGAGLSKRGEPRRAHLVTVTSPDGKTYTFAATLQNQSTFSSVPTADVVFVPVGNTPRGTKLSPVGYDSFVALGISGGTNGTSFELHTLDDFGDPDSRGFYNPTEFVLEMRNGTTMRLRSSDDENFGTSGSSKGSGLVEIRDRNGNTLSFRPNGIFSSNGKSLRIERTGEFITAITDANGKSYKYQQNGGGDLTAVTNRVGDTTTYQYDARHLITAIRDPRGFLPVRNLYDADGRLIAVMDAKGNTTRFEHDLASGKETTVDAMGNPTFSTYDSYGNVTKTEKPITTYKATEAGMVTGSAVLSSSTRYSTDPSNRDKPTQVRQSVDGNPVNDRISYMAYNENGDMTESTDPLGHKTFYTFDRFGKPLSVTDPLGRVTVTKSYEFKGNLQSTTDALGNITSVKYENARHSGLPTTIIDALGSMSSMTYDSETGRLTDMRDATKHGTSFSYDENGNKIGTKTNRTRLVDGLPTNEDIVTQTVYDPEERVLQNIAPDGSTSRMVYNEIGKIAERYDASGRVTRYEYDELGRQVKTTRPDGIHSFTEYDENDRVRWSASERVRENGTIGLLYSRSLYDEAGRAYCSETWEGEPDETPNNTGAVRLSRSFTNLNLVSESVGGLDSRGIATGATEYDLAGRAKRSVDSLGNVTGYVYNDAGEQISVIDALGHVSTMVYDDTGRVTSSSSPVSTTRTVYDALGRRVSGTDGSGRVTQFEYDKVGRLQSVVGAGGFRTVYVYDEVGHKISQTDAKGCVTRFDYDEMGRMIARTLPLGQREEMYYRLDGKLTGKLDFNQNFTGYKYDDDVDSSVPLGKRAGRLLERTGYKGIVAIKGSECGSVSYTYYMDGTRHTATRRVRDTHTNEWLTTSLKYSYDLRGRIVKITGDVGTIAYSYDNNGNKKSVSKLSSANGFPIWTVNYEYDNLNRLLTVVHPDGKRTAYEYDSVGNRKRFVRPNGVVTTYGYDQGNRLVSVNNSVGSSFAYTLDGMGRRLTTNDSGHGSTNYEYDVAGRLVHELGHAGNIAYQYDSVGNREAITKNGVTTRYLYDANDRMISEITNGEGSNAYGYDANGNMTNRTTTIGASTNTLTLSYDFEDKLLATLSTDGQATSYLLDATGNRIQKLVEPSGDIASNRTTNYLVDSTTSYAQVVEESDSTGIVTRYDIGEEIVRMDRNSASGFEGNGSLYFLYDGLGSTVGLTDGLGNLPQSYAYDAYGNLTTDNDTYQPFLGLGGQQFDSELGLYYLRARYYAPTLGVFITQDGSLGRNEAPTTQHRYLYANADPINNTDPTGYETLFSIQMTTMQYMALTGAIFGAAVGGGEKLVSSGGGCLTR